MCTPFFTCIGASACSVHYAFINGLGVLFCNLPPALVLYCSSFSSTWRVLDSIDGEARDASEMARTRRVLGSGAGFGDGIVSGSSGAGASLL
jgi:hypothetical protein